MTGRKSEYLVVFNDTYSMLFDHLLPDLRRSCSDYAMQDLERISNDRRGDIFETATTRMFFQGNLTGILELNATAFMMHAMLEHVFEGAKDKWRLACQWKS